MRKFIVFFNFLTVLSVAGCGVVLDEKDSSDTGSESKSFCGDSLKACRQGEACIKGANGEYCGCEDAGKATCRGGGVCSTDLFSDPYHCGSCGETCQVRGQAKLGKDMKCEKGRCVCYHEGEVVEDLNVGVVVGSGDTREVLHCGSCGYHCSEKGETIFCQGGKCGDSSCENSGEMRCGEVCVDLDRDRKHCGRCDVDCGKNGSCVDGECQCADGEVPCKGGSGGGCTVQDDTVCGVMCADCTKRGMVCVLGECRCKKGEVACGPSKVSGTDESCVVESDEQCGSDCVDCMVDGKVCYTGRCVGAEDTFCGGEGEFVCGEGEVCDCEEVAPGYVCFGGICACGRAEELCKEGERCEDGDCVCDGPEWKECGSGCKKVKGEDANNCGDCGTVCKLAHAQSRCESGNCRLLSCDEGWENCDGRDDNGCESDLSKPETCGDCNNECTGEMGCDGGTCGCSADKKDCGGTCIDVMGDDANNCGDCGEKCPSGQACSAGKCVCPSGTKDCGSGECIDVMGNNVNHCGSCGESCSSGEVCSVGKCICPMGTKDCGSGVCINVMGDDANNCGNCGESCSADEVCSVGKCVCPSGQVPCGSGGACVAQSKDACGGSCTKCSGTTDTCVGGVCKCIEGAKRCSDDLYAVEVCRNGAWAHDTFCLNVCHNGECTGSSFCRPPNVDCGDGRCCPTLWDCENPDPFAPKCLMVNPEPL